ncbi:hypothetical protein GSS87_07420 [Corynebacterium sp. 4HC-13]|uniref:hypothetical protein n=1 Tax=Corynebacterium anserum TaxID=2684406 RepID=UPI00163AA461|nr:hypothetical protein [Corynebacterium anserum]MBC2682226.1 hypothetical protein [Corynebacterium anserum]
MSDTEETRCAPLNGDSCRWVASQGVVELVLVGEQIFNKCVAAAGVGHADGATTLSWLESIQCIKCDILHGEHSFR